MRKRTYRLALGGILSALAIVFILIGAVFPFSQYIGPCLASASVMIFLVECGYKWAFIMYLAVSGIVLLLSPDIESSALFVFFLGWYPLLKIRTEYTIKRTSVQYIIKFSSLCVSVYLMYYVLLHIMTVSALADEFAGYGLGMYIILIIAATVAFFLVDICLTRIAYAYIYKFRKRLFPEN